MLPKQTLRLGLCRTILRPKARSASSKSQPEASRSQSDAARATIQKSQPSLSGPQDTQEKPKKTTAQMDEELRAKMAGIAGDGGEAGVEYEDGQPVAMKRGVKDNMFRYI